MTQRFFRLDSDHDCQVWLSSGDGMPALLHWGEKLPEGEDLAQVAAAIAPPLPHGGLDVPETVSWLPEPGQGFTDWPGIELRRGHQRVYLQGVLRGAQSLGGGWLFEVHDEVAGVKLDLRLAVEARSGVFTATATLTNTGPDELAVEQMASVCLALPPEAEERLSIGGRWSAEFQAHRERMGRGTWVQEARTGRSSHHAYPGSAVLERGTDDSSGRVWSAQIEWSGNHRTVLQRTRLGGLQWQLGELLLPGEVVLAPGAVHSSPPVHLLHGSKGLRDVALRWQDFVRRCVLPPAPRSHAPVQFNSWEATYFDHDEARMRALASAAASLGIERFVLDDGWFQGRRNDRAGLGDWTPCPQRYPNGLAPLSRHCRELGMEFGLWVEPEGVNENSVLFRTHPEWVLQVPGRRQPLGRHQHVLDLGRPEVQQHLFERLDGLVRDTPVDFLKWDMNRDFTHEAGADGRPGVRRHVQGLHAVLDRLRAAHPKLEIETCASGGGRADLAMLRRTRRVWVSDCNDPLERQKMHAAFLQFLPPEIMGAHVGPAHSHTTGRHATIALRTQVAWPGHLGVEADLLALDDEERSALRQAIDAHRETRTMWSGLAASGLHIAEGVCAVWLVDATRQQGWLSVVATARSADAQPPVARLPGLSDDTLYRVATHPLWPAPGHGAKQGGLLDRHAQAVLSGRALRAVGIRLPLLWPGAGCVVTVRAVP